MPSVSPVIFGCAGEKLTPQERDLFKQVRPFGLILFDRNIRHPLQLAELTAEFRACVRVADAPILVDQEGGRIARLDALQWRMFPSARKVGWVYDRNPEKGLRVAYLHGLRMGHMARAVGINVLCSPVCDLYVEGADGIIGDRAYSSSPHTVKVLAHAYSQGLMAAGVFPVMKHIPGHGRAQADSHKMLPVVTTSLEELQNTDFVPFAHLKHIPFAMSAHVLYSALDAKRCASLSRKVTRQIIRKHMGFQGLLMSDDIGMQALTGDMPTRARNVLRGGCDLALYCRADIEEMRAIAAALPSFPLITQLRWRMAKKRLVPQPFYDPADTLREFESLVTSLASNMDDLPLLAHKTGV